MDRYEEAKSRLYVALDVPNMEEARDIAQELKGQVGGLKVGLTLAATAGFPQACAEFGEMGFSVFWDQKLHDIPEQVAGAVRNICFTPGVSMFTIHASGGPRMADAVRRAVNICCPNGDGPKILAVTVLTSLDHSDMEEMGFMTPVNYGDPKEKQDQEQHEMRRQVRALALMVQDYGIDGIVCSPQETDSVREYLQPETLVVNPAIRFQDGEQNDQKRAGTPQVAIANGADILVVGRPIIAATEPAKTAQQFVQAIAEALPTLSRNDNYHTRPRRGSNCTDEDEVECKRMGRVCPGDNNGKDCGQLSAANRRRWGRD